MLILTLLTALAMAQSPAPGPVCDANWEEARRGGCWIQTAQFGESLWAYVHPRGWVVDHRCFSDSRFTGARMLAALETAWSKMTGGCLARYNPVWARELADAPWRRRMRVVCAPEGRGTGSCATHIKADGFRELAPGRTQRVEGHYRLLRVEDVDRCSSLAGVMFHETLHGDDADNVPVETHNKGYDRPQLSFIRDRVYAAQALCFLPPSQVNTLQCREVARHRGYSAPEDLCRGFSASFTDMPAGFLQH